MFLLRRGCPFGLSLGRVCAAKEGHNTVPPYTLLSEDKRSHHCPSSQIPDTLQG